MKRTIALAAAVLILGGCGGKANESAAPATSPPAASAPTDGCSAETSEEMYVAELYNCASRSTKVYKFQTATARDDWRKAAEGFGTVVLNQGDTWLEVKA